MKKGGAGISSRWKSRVDLLISSGKAPAAIHAQLLLEVNEASDKILAKESLPTRRQIVSRKYNRRNSLKASWNLSSHADLSVLFLQHIVRSKADYDKIVATGNENTMIVWGVYRGTNGDGESNSYMNFNSPKLCEVLQAAGLAFGSNVPFLGDGVHKVASNILGV